jgi:hypothetical protein
MSELTRLACAPESAIKCSGRNRYAFRSRRDHWSIEDLRLLRELAASGTPLNAIAATLRRTPSAIKNKAGMQGISLRLRP